MRTAASPPVDPARTRRRTLTAMCIAQFMIMLDITIVNIALPAMQHQLHMSTGGLEWVVSAYSLSLAALIPFGGALGDRFGRKRWFLVGMVVFVVGSIACALSPSAACVIAFRAVQGVGGALMSALTLSILTQAYPPHERAAAIGTWGALGGMGFGVGPVVGGLLLTVFGWSSVFWVNVPIAVVGFVLAAIAVQDVHGSHSQGLDVLGVIASAIGLVGITFGLIESSSHAWLSAPVAGSVALGIVALGAFVVIEGRVAFPMVPLELLRSRSFSTSVTLYLANYIGLTGVLFFMTLLYQDVVGWSVLHTGLSWLIMNGPFVVVARYAGRLNRRFGSARVISVGAFVFAIAAFLLSRVTTTTPFALTVVGYIGVGAGAGALVPGVAHVAMRDVPRAVSGAASGVLNAGRQIGTSVGLAVLGSISVHAATSAWTGADLGAAGADRARVAAQAASVGAGRISAVTDALGPSVRGAAVHAYLHGESLALTVAACGLVLGSGLAAVLLRGTPVTETSAAATVRVGTTTGEAPDVIARRR